MDKKPPTSTPKPSRHAPRKRPGSHEHDKDDGHIDRWMVSYADFVTLLFAFFVVMYSVSTADNTGRFKAFADSVAFVFHFPSFPFAPIKLPGEPSVPSIKTIPASSYKNKVLADKHTAELGVEQRKVEDHVSRIASDLNKVLKDVIKQDNVRVEITKRGVVVDISASTLFESADAALQASSLPVLSAVAEVLSKVDDPIEIEGHTDDLPIATPKFPSNWELSAVRASSVARYLMGHGVVESRLSVIGLASNLPLVPNINADNRSRNRRVTITVASPNLEREQLSASDESVK